MQKLIQPDRYNLSPDLRNETKGPYQNYQDCGQSSKRANSALASYMERSKSRKGSYDPKFQAD